MFYYYDRDYFDKVRLEDEYESRDFKGINVYISNTDCASCSKLDI